MPRPERALDVTAGPLPRFAADLRELRRAAGGMPYRQMARVANYSATVLSDAAAGRRLPTLAVTLAYVAACGGDEEEWRARWHDLAREIAPDNGSAREAAREVGTGDGSAARPEETGSGRPAARPWLVTLLVAAVVVLFAAAAVLTVLILRAPDVVVAPGGAMPEHMVPFNEVTEAEFAHDDPPPALPCSKLDQAVACLDLERGLVWVRDLPPGDGHHAAGYWTTTDGAVHGECHNYLTSDVAWATCRLPELPGAGRIRLRAAISEKEMVLTWGPYRDVPTG